MKAFSKSQSLETCGLSGLQFTVWITGRRPHSFDCRTSQRENNKIKYYRIRFTKLRAYNNKNWGLRKLGGTNCAAVRFLCACQNGIFCCQGKTQTPAMVCISFLHTLGLSPHLFMWVAQNVVEYKQSAHIYIYNSRVYLNLYLLFLFFSSGWYFYY